MCVFVDTCACVYCLPGSNAVFSFVFCLDMALSFVMLLLCALNCPLGTNKVFLGCVSCHDFFFTIYSSRL